MQSATSEAGVESSTQRATSELTQVSTIGSTKSDNKTAEATINSQSPVAPQASIETITSETLLFETESTTSSVLNVITLSNLLNQTSQTEKSVSSATVIPIALNEDGKATTTNAQSEGSTLVSTTAAQSEESKKVIQAEESTAAAKPEESTTAVHTEESTTVSVQAEESTTVSVQAEESTTTAQNESTTMVQAEESTTAIQTEGSTTSVQAEEVQNESTTVAPLIIFPKTNKELTIEPSTVKSDAETSTHAEETSTTPQIVGAVSQLLSEVEKSTTPANDAVIAVSDLANTFVGNKHIEDLVQKTKANNRTIVGFGTKGDLMIRTHQYQPIILNNKNILRVYRWQIIIHWKSPNRLRSNI